MPFVNDSRNTSVATNDALADSGLTWNEMTGTWDAQEGTWDNPRRPYANDAKNVSTSTNDAKN